MKQAATFIQATVTKCQTWDLDDVVRELEIERSQVVDWYVKRSGSLWVQWKANGELHSGTVRNDSEIQGGDWGDCEIEFLSEDQEILDLQDSDVWFNQDAVK